MGKKKTLLMYILGGIIPVFILIILSIFNNVFPLGEQTLNVYDGSMQHPGFLSYFKEVLLGNNSLFYSFKGALGYNFFTTFIYYLASPLNLFVVFFKTEYLSIFYSILIYVKIGLSAVTFLILLNYFKKKKSNIIFSSIYALMGYNLVYFSNYMWIDSVIMLPLVILGIEKLINENKKIFYVVSLTLSILFNFYIGFMIVLFNIIYFIYKIISSNIKKETIKSFIILTLLSGLICSIFIIPVFFELLNGKAQLYSNNMQTNYFEGSLDFIYAFYKTTVGSFATRDISYGTPNIYCSLFVISLVFLFFFNKNFSKKEKIIVLSIIIFYLLSFSFNLIDYAWHFMQRPIWFPNRYSFTLSFFLILIAFKSFNKINDIKLSKKMIICFIILLIIYIVSFILKEVYTDKVLIFFAIFSIMLLLLYFITFTLKINKKLIYITFIFVFIELLINCFYTFKNIDFINSIEYKVIESKSFLKDLNLIKNKEKSNFYKIEFNDTIIHNSGALYNYNGINYFNSLRNGKVMYFLENIIGTKVIDDCRITYDSFNPLINTLLGIKYFEGNKNEYYYTVVSDNNRIIYENDLVLPFMFLNDNNEKYNFKKGDYINNLEKIFNSYSTNINFIEKLNTKVKNVKIKNNYYYKTKNNASVIYTKKLNSNGWIIFSTLDNFKEYLPTIYKNGEKLEIDYNNKTTFYFNKGDNIKIVYDLNKEKVKKNEIDIYFLDYNKFKNIIKEINKNKVEILEYKKDNKLKVNVKTEDKQNLETFIPYDKGWKIYVDGKKAEVKKKFDTFISIPLDKGSHIVEFKFIPRGLILGSIISCLSIITLIIYLKKSKKKLT